MEKQHCYPYPRPAVSVDIVVFRETENGREVLLIKRKKDPYQGEWALPGGFVDENEPLEKAASRELEEETGLERVPLHQVAAFGDPGRDPRGHTISIAFTGGVDTSRKVKGGDDAAEATWMRIDKLPQLAFDHAEIIRAAAAAR
jgi:8-oxo-dGTP diphosphatase